MNISIFFRVMPSADPSVIAARCYVSSCSVTHVLKSLKLSLCPLHYCPTEAMYAYDSSTYSMNEKPNYYLAIRTVAGHSSEYNRLLPGLWSSPG